MLAVDNKRSIVVDYGRRAAHEGWQEQERVKTQRHIHAHSLEQKRGVSLLQQLENIIDPTTVPGVLRPIPLGFTCTIQGGLIQEVSMAESGSGRHQLFSTAPRLRERASERSRTPLSTTLAHTPVNLHLHHSLHSAPHQSTHSSIPNSETKQKRRFCWSPTTALTTPKTKKYACRD